MTKSQCIATMNDQLRRSIGIFGISTSHLGRVMLSAGIAALDPETIDLNSRVAGRGPYELPAQEINYEVTCVEGFAHL